MSTPPENNKIWFYAKTYGWGWSLPACWQGWVVFFGYLFLVFGGMLFFKRMPLYLGYVLSLTGILIAICWIKGEKLTWRWGEKTTSNPKTNLRALLLLHLFMGPLLLCFSVYFRTHLPAEMNPSYGYRTHTSMLSQEAWDEAQIFSANLMIIAAVITIIFQAVSAFTMKPHVSLITSTLVLTLTLCLTLPVTEIYLNKHFDSSGKRIGIN
jgi:hypothetical protein